MYKDNNTIEWLNDRLFPRRKTCYEEHRNYLKNTVCLKRKLFENTVELKRKEKKQLNNEHLKQAEL